MRHQDIKLVMCCAVGAAGVLSGCAAPRINTTMLTTPDIIKMTDRMAESLNASAPIAGRSPASPKWVFTMDRVTNRTEHLLDDSEKWGIMARFRANLARTLLANERAIAFVLPAAEWQRYANADFAPEQARLRPTHALRAEFRSDTSSSLTARRDAYLCAFQLLDLESGSIVWEDSYEVKYSVVRNSFD
jgi:PBP1b-binding outer membrane lipoprotein LpoB